MWRGSCISNATMQITVFSPPTHPPTLCTLSHVFPQWRLHVHTNLKNWILSPVMTPLSSVPISYWQYTSSRAPVCRGGGGPPKDNEDNIGAHITPYLD